jgi:hypothetical protein
VRGEIANLLRQKEGIEIIEMNVQSDHISSDSVDTAEIRGISGDGLLEGKTGDSASSKV